jgi:hypothetical protein
MLHPPEPARAQAHPGVGKTMNILRPGPEYNKSSPDQLAANSCGGLFLTRFRAFFPNIGKQVVKGLLIVHVVKVIEFN